MTVLYFEADEILVRQMLCMPRTSRIVGIEYKAESDQIVFKVIDIDVGHLDVDIQQVKPVISRNDRYTWDWNLDEKVSDA